MLAYLLYNVYLQEASRMNIVCNVVCTNVARDAKKAIRCSSNWNKSIVNYKYLKFFENSNKSAVLEKVETYQNLILLSIMYYVNKKRQKTRKYKNIILCNKLHGVPINMGIQRLLLYRLRFMWHFLWNKLLQYSSLNFENRKHLVLRFSKCGLPFLYLQNWRRYGQS